MRNVKDKRERKLAQVHLSRDPWNSEMRVGLVFGVEGCEPEKADLIVISLQQKSTLAEVRGELSAAVRELDAILDGEEYNPLVRYRSPA